ncbi:clathrin adaptor, mu subunit, partial [Hymenopellis radicata]
VRHVNNEIYFDIAETLKALVSRTGNTLSSSVRGRIDVDSRLSGVPDCTLTLSNPSLITHPAFHPCIRLARWSSHQSMSFVPPDGKFVLADYQLPQAPPIPITLKITSSPGKFEILLTSRMTTHIMEKVELEIPFGSPVPGLRGIGSSWTWDARSHVLRFEMPQIPPSGRYALKAEWNPDATPSPAHVVLVHFSVSSHTFSSLRVSKFTDGIDITSYMPPPPFKAEKAGFVRSLAKSLCTTDKAVAVTGGLAGANHLELSWYNVHFGLSLPPLETHHKAVIVFLIAPFSVWFLFFLAFLSFGFSNPSLVQRLDSVPYCTINSVLPDGVIHVFDKNPGEYVDIIMAWLPVSGVLIFGIQRTWAMWARRLPNARQPREQKKSANTSPTLPALTPDNSP